MANEAAVVKEKTVKAPKVKTWFMDSANTRELAAKLTQMSASGHEIFSVSHNENVGGSFEILSYTEK